MNLLEKVSFFRTKKLNYLNRYILFAILYFLNTMIWCYGDASLGNFASLGGLIISPILFAVIYCLSLILTFWSVLSFINTGFKKWLTEWHKITLPLALLFYDISIIYLIFSLFIKDLFN